MFSTGHLLWIGISFALIVGGFIAIRIRRASLDEVLKWCLVVGVASEVVKVFSVTVILPMVTPQISGGELVYEVTGTYTPYMELAHLPLELCSLMILFLALALWSKDKAWRESLLTVMYITGVIGGLMGILLAYITSEFNTVQDYFTSPRVWQYFLYHAMVVTLGLYLGFGRENSISLRSFKSTILCIVVLDLPTFYLNSVFSQPVYAAEKPVGLVYRTNFFSSYVNPLGLVLTEKWQWIAYLCVRMALASVLIALLLWLAGAVGKNRRKG
ncbi:MAG: YwaF family protein [Oscillospiraceae bacterium]|nr:YwaF family protein [Oscillospiraceae bacterium]